ncbi:MAG: carboxypeptidase regulatory-like domain-containing protein [Terriglobia bacterium]
MMKKRLLGVALAGLAAICFWARMETVRAQTAPSAALAGVVSSQEEGPMEGVLVSAKREGAKFTVTVVSDAQGRYSFPSSRLEPGQYAVRIRAVGYELPNPGPVTVAAQRTTQLELKLRKAADVAYHLSNGEWLLSMPGTEAQKQQFLGCVSCHTLERIVRSRYNAQEFAQVVRRMSGYAQGSTPLRPQLRPDRGGRGGDMDAQAGGENDRALRLGQYASTINLSQVSRWEYPLKTLPRPTGKGTRVIMTEYDLPRPEALPHDAIVDKDGSVWYGDFGSQFLGKLNPKTGEIVEYPIPLAKPGAPTGGLDLNFDPDGNIFLGMMMQGVVAKFDPRTKTFENCKNPKYNEGDAARTAMVTPTRLNVDGKIWVGADAEYQVDFKACTWTPIDYTKGVPPNMVEAAKRIGSYGVAVDSQNNFYGLNLGGTYVTRIDAKTMVSKPFATPTPNSGPRRGHMDPQDRLFFAEFRGNRIAMFDTKAEKFTEWAMPIAWTNPYDAIVDKDGFAWGSGMTNDFVGRVNTKSGEVTMYLLPGTTNVRRVDVDNSTSPPTFWIGDNLGATLIRVEPLD